MVRAIEGHTVATNEVQDLECGVCGQKLGFDTGKLNEAIDHCGVRYGLITQFNPASIPYTVQAVKLPDELLQDNQNKEKEEKELEREEERQAASAKKEKASTKTTSSRKK